MDSARAGELSPTSEAEDAAQISISPSPPSNPSDSDATLSTLQSYRCSPAHSLPQCPASTASTDELQSARAIAAPAPRLPPSTPVPGNNTVTDSSSGDVAGSLPHGPAASGSVHDDNFLQPHGLAVMGLPAMQKSPFIDDTREVSRSVTSPSENSSLASLDLPEYLGLPEYRPEPPRQREVSALSAVLQSVASSQAEEIRRQASTVSWAPRDPSGFHLGTIEDIPEAPAAAPELSPRLPATVECMAEASDGMAELRARFRPPDAAAVGPCGYATARIRCCCRLPSTSTQSGEPAAVGRQVSAWGSVSPAAAADVAAAAAGSRAAPKRTASQSLHPDEQGAMLRMCGASAAEYGVVFVPPGIAAALQALAHLLGFQRWLHCAAMETCPEQGVAGVAKVGSLFRSRSVRLQQQSATGSVRPVVFYGIHDHEVQGEFWSHIDCEVVVRILPLS